MSPSDIINQSIYKCFRVTFAIIAALDTGDNMARRLVILIMISVSLSSCMEMKETVERMVMVRTTGSDLQPAATGFIYKRNSDGPAKVIKMGEDEILEQLKKLPESIYEQPKAFAAPIPAAAGPFDSKETDENKSASHASEAYVIPVVEKAEDDEEKGDGKIDGIANEDYAKILGEYAADHGDYNGDFSDYFHGFGDYEKKIAQGDDSDYDSEGNSDQKDKGNKGYASSHQYGKGGAGDYHTEKHESFSVSAKGGDDNAYDGDHYGALKKGHGHAKSEEAGRFRKLHEKDDVKEDGDFFDGENLPRGFGKIAHGHGYFGSDTGGYQAGDSDDAGFYEGGVGDGYLEHQAEDEYGIAHGDDESGSKYHKLGDFGVNGGYFDGKSYGFEVKHRR